MVGLYFMLVSWSLYSSMVERNTVNIFIDVRFILRALSYYRKVRHSKKVRDYRRYIYSIDNNWYKKVYV